MCTIKQSSPRSCARGCAMSSIETPNIAGSRLSGELVRCILRRLSSKAIGRISHLGAVSRGWARRRATSGCGTAPTREQRAASSVSSCPKFFRDTHCGCIFSDHVVDDCNAVESFQEILRDRTVEGNTMSRMSWPIVW